MMKKRSPYEINKKILLCVRETPGLHPNELNKKIGTNPSSLKTHLEYLEASEDLEVQRVEKDPANGQPSFRLYPTKKGNKTLENLEKRNSIIK